MRDPSTFQLVAAIGQLVARVLWAATARGDWNVLRNRRPRSTLFRLLHTVTAAAAVHYLPSEAVEPGALVPGTRVEITLPLAAGGAWS